jgi:RNA polymerase sigma-70 factor (ECF subfamily)
LLGRLRQVPTDQAAWAQFVRQYGPKIYAWCRKWDLQDADAQDVSQLLLTKLAEKLRTFSYDPARSFRAWLKTLAQHACSDFRADQKRHGARDGRGLALLESQQARADLVQSLEEEFDLELLEEAIARVRLRVRPRTWEAFRLTALEGQSGAQAADRLGMKVAAVFVAKSKVRKMLRDAIHKLERPGPS